MATTANVIIYMWDFRKQRKKSNSWKQTTEK